MQSVLLERRARLHAALGDPHRLAIIDGLVLSDRAPSELGALLGLDSNLLSHHLGVLERLGLIERVVSEGDRRRRYVRLIPAPLAELTVGTPVRVARVVFVCTENIARSQLAAALWNHLHPDLPAICGGTHPGQRVHPAAVRAAARRRLDLRHARPGPVPRTHRTDLVITVCDRAHEALPPSGRAARLHWSVPDPVASEDPAAFDSAADALDDRIHHLGPLVRSP
ncbi:MAG: helix-turn-helix domain-containing protein [Acidimicrobiales bacterium]